MLTFEDTKDNRWGAARVMADGSLKLQKTDHGEARPPKSSEELRSRVKVMGIAWEFIRLKHPSKAYFQTLSPAVWDEHLDWLLGDQGYNQVVKDHLGEVIYKPAWHTLLSFENQTRKAAFKLVILKRR